MRQNFKALLKILEEPSTSFRQVCFSASSVEYLVEEFDIFMENSIQNDIVST